METDQKRLIENNFWDLVLLTKCNVTCTSVLRQYGVLEQEDIAELASIPNEIKKAEKLYEIVLTKKGSFPHLIKAFEAGCQTGVLAIFNQLGKNEGTRTSDEQPGSSAQKRRKKMVSIQFDVLPPVLHFTGRVLELAELHQKLQKNDLERRVVISQLASIVGLGGIGKTELARKYIQVYGETFYDGNVIWINAQTEESLRESFCRLASGHLKLYLTNLEKKDKDIKTIVDEVYSYFGGQKVLFVLDNADCTEHLQKSMPLRLSSSSKPYVLITSRDREWAFSAQVLELDEMSEQDAISFVRKSLEMKDDDDDKNESVLNLVNKLQRYPLALCQAVSYIRQRQMGLGRGNFSIEKYLEKYKKFGAEKLLNSKIPPAQLNSYTETTLTTWRVTTAQISKNEKFGRCAMQILNCISYFLPEKIPYCIFSNLLDGDDYEDALHLLVKYSMVKVQASEKTISVHRLVQEVTRIELKRTGEEEQTLKIGLQLLSSSITERGEDASIPHALSILKYARILKPKIFVEFKYLRWKIVEVLNLAKNFKQSKNVFMELKLEDQFIHDDPDFYRFVHQSAINVLYAENDEEIYEIYLKLLHRMHSKYIENEGTFSSYETFAIKQLLVDYLQNLKRYKEALELALSNWALRMQLNGLNQWQTIDASVSVLTSFYKLICFESLPNPPGAEAMEPIAPTVYGLKKLHKRNLEMIGKDINWTNSMCNLAKCLEEIGAREIADEIVNDVIERTNNCDCEADKRYVRIVINCLDIQGRMKSDDGEHEEALVIYKNIHSKYVSLKGWNHRETLSANLNVVRKLEELKKQKTKPKKNKKATRRSSTYEPLTEKSLLHAETENSLVTTVAAAAVGFAAGFFLTVAVSCIARQKGKNRSKNSKIKL